MKSLTIKLPAKVEAEDYYEFDDIKDMFKQLGAKVKIYKAYGNSDDGYYIGILYTGSMKDPAFKKLKKEIEAEFNFE